MNASHQHWFVCQLFDLHRENLARTSAVANRVLIHRLGTKFKFTPDKGLCKLSFFIQVGKIER